MSSVFRRRPRLFPKTGAGPFSMKGNQRQAKQFEESWEHVQACCVDPDSQVRLLWLHQQYGKSEHGVSESALAEIETARLLLRAGLSLSFVKEKDSRTADIECYLDHHRLFVEVTVIVPSAANQHTGTERVSVGGSHVDAESQNVWEDGMVRRVLARIAEKSAQLADYCAPILLAISIVYDPNRFPLPTRNSGRRMAMGLQQMGGVLTGALANFPPISGVLLTLKNIQPGMSKANIRLANVCLGTWVPGPHGQSQVRLLVMNPSGRHGIEREVGRMLRRVL